jgi:GTP-binding protein
VTASSVGDLPLVAIVGRPNVGKSELFNRLTSSRDALVEDLPGTTRDRHYGVFEWRGRHLRVVDTGGYLIEDEEDPFSPLIRAGVERALGEASLVLFVVDAVDGALSADEEIADVLRRAEVPVILVANKVDVTAGALGVGELHAIGLGEPFAVSAHHGLGIGDLMDMIVDRVGRR